MKALVSPGTASLSLAERPKPDEITPSDAMFRATTTTIRGTDVRIRRGEVRGAKVPTGGRRSVTRASRSPMPSMRRRGSARCRSGRIDPDRLLTHRFRLDDIVDACDTFARGVDGKALAGIIARAVA
jgi:threonine dehydrogenase-like Zn-dependent dehydrogenase